MKLINYDREYLILQNVKSVERQPTPEHYSKAQFQILCNLIRQKPISKQFFNFIVLEIFNKENWKELTYDQMYQLIHILTYYDYKKERKKDE